LPAKKRHQDFANPPAILEHWKNWQLRRPANALNAVLTPLQQASRAAERTCPGVGGYWHGARLPAAQPALIKASET
jgi:hypothetical protein